jgi:FkbM family methyltransferase
VSEKRFRFVLRNLMYLRNFQGVIQALADRGHKIVITTSPYDLKIPEELRQLARSLETPYRGISFGLTYEREDWWAPASRLIRNVANLLHYRRPEYKDAPALTARAERRAGPVPTILFPRVLCSFPLVARALRMFVRFLDAGLPPDRAIISELKTTRVDALILTPMVDLETEQLEWVRAARAAGVPTCLLVASWDNLTNKGLIQVPPDRIVVWNEFQKREAVELHRIPAENIIITGAQLYDEWFERKPSRDYETFCRDFGFDPKRPTILYCGSSIFIARDEVVFVREWLEKVRNAQDSALRTANILVRPHPMHQVPFDELDVSRYERVTVHPRSGGMPVVESNKADFFDALYHAALVVGINTSALIEAAILGRRSFSVADPRYQRTQEGTLHFHYLIEGGIMQRAPDFDTHLKQLADELKRSSEDRRSLSKFIESFIRPGGLDRPATPILADAVASITEIKPYAPPGALRRISATIVLAPIAALAWIPERAGPAGLDFLTRVFRFGLFNIARIKRSDTASLVARRTPLDYPRAPISILVTSPRENLMKTRSVMSEPWTVHWLEKVVEAGDVLYDVGANVGTYSLVAAIAHNQTVRVFAFEPSFVTYAALCRNILENGCEKSITPMPIALTGDKGNTVFKYRSLISGAANHALGQQTLATKDFKETKPVYQQRILAVPVDSLTQDFNLEAPNHIKLDVDGGELEVLRGAAVTLANGTVKTVLVDARDDKDSVRLTEYLRQLGFGLAAKFNGVDASGFHAVFARDSEVVGSIMAECPLPETEKDSRRGEALGARSDAETS